MAEKKQKVGDIVFTSKEMKEALMANADGSQENYVGLGDDMVNFGSADSFIDESDAAREFTMRITNNTSTTQKIQLKGSLAISSRFLFEKANVLFI